MVSSSIGDLSAHIGRDWFRCDTLMSFCPRPSWNGNGKTAKRPLRPTVSHNQWLCLSDLLVRNSSLSQNFTFSKAKNRVGPTSTTISGLASSLRPNSSFVAVVNPLFSSSSAAFQNLLSLCFLRLNGNLNQKSIYLD